MTTINFFLISKESLTFDCETLKEAVVKAVEDGADLRSADLRSAGLYLAYLHNAYLCDADLRDADLRSADLRGAELRGTYLSNADLRGADLRGVDLSNAYLRGSDLRGAELRGSNLSGATLSGADLRGSNLSGATLSGADLCGAELCGAYLSNADLRGADLRDALYNCRKLWSRRPILQLGCCGSIGRTTIVFLFADGGSPVVKCGCFTGNVDEFEAKIHERHGGRFHEAEYMTMVAHIRAIHSLQKEYGENEK